MASHYPTVSRAVVVSQDTNLWGVRVMLLSGQVPPMTFQVLRNGFSDGIRIAQKSLPVVGTWGAVAFVNSDERMGYWLGSVDVNYITAVQQVSASSQSADPYVDFYSHYSGYVSYLDSLGISFKQFSDGTYLLASTSTTPPSFMRQIVNADETLSTVSLNLADRIESIPSPRYFILNHASGTNATINPLGDTSLNVASGATLNATCGGTSVSIDSSGNTSVNGASNAQLNLSFNGAQIQINSSGAVTISTSQPVNVSGSVINLEAPVVLGTSSGGQATSPGPIKMQAPSLLLSQNGGATQPVMLDAFYTWFVSTYMPSVQYVSGSPGSPPSNSVSTVLQAE